jgi:hypothetical protein
MHPHIAGSNPALSAIFTSELVRRPPTPMSEDRIKSV